MRIVFRHIISTFFFLTLSLGLMNCAQNKQNGKIRIVATTGIIGDVLRSCLDTSAVIDVLMKPGVDPHLYKATAGDVSLLMNADIIVHNGLHLEGKMTEVLHKLSKKKFILAMSDQLPEERLRLIDGAHDPHLWFDVELWSTSLKGVLNQVKDRYPSLIAKNEQRINDYLHRLHTLHQTTDSLIELIPEKRRILITAHDAFGYFGDAYGVKVVGLQGMSTLSDFGMNDLQRIGDIIIHSGIPSIFVEMSIAPRSMESLLHNVRSRGGNVSIGGNLYADALDSPGTKGGTYVGMIKHNVSTISQALR